MKTVYGFTKYHITTDKNVVSKLKATKERIEKIGAVPIEESAQEVEDSEVNSDGEYNPAA